MTLYKPKKKTKRGKSPLKAKKDLAWKLCSHYIRRKYANENGFCSCVTCGIKKHWKEMQAGHFIPGRNNSILFEETNIHPQCVKCNMYDKELSKINYYNFMIVEYGQEEVLRLMDLKDKVVKITESDFEDLIEYYRDCLVGLDIRNEINWREE